MRRLLFALMCLCASQPAMAQLRRPSCEALVGFVYSGRAGVVEQSFGKAFDTMTADCVDEVEAGPPDVPGLLPRELKRTRLQMLSLLEEDLKYFRNLRRERDRRSVSR